MPVMNTERWGTIAYEPGAEIEFPRGLPGFETRRRFVAVHQPASHPLVFLQSLEEPGLCFLTAPAAAVEPDYRLEIGAEDLDTLGWDLDRPPSLKDVLCLAVLTVRENGPSANLLAPVVVNLSNRVAVQAVSPEPRYSHRHALAPEEALVCS